MPDTGRPGGLVVAMINPVLDRELRERMRTPRAAIVLTVYLALLGVVMAFVYQARAGDPVAGAGQFDPFTGLPSVQATEVASIGRGIFEWVLFFMLLLVLFLVPGLTSGAISGERERQTLVPLQLTLLRPRSIVLGKLGASVAFLFLLLVATAPLLAVAYLIGGIAMNQVLAALGAVLAVGVILAAITVACSAMLRRTQTATVVAYAIVLLMVIGTFLAYAVAALAVDDDGIGSGGPSEAILYLNPVVMTADIIGGLGDPTLDTSSPFDPIREAVTPEVDEFVQEDVAFAAVGVEGPPVPFDGAFPGDEPRDGDGPVFWQWSLGILSLSSALALVVAVRRLRTPARTER